MPDKYEFEIGSSKYEIEWSRPTPPTPQDFDSIAAGIRGQSAPAARVAAPTAPGLRLPSPDKPAYQPFAGADRGATSPEPFHQFAGPDLKAAVDPFKKAQYVFGGNKPDATDCSGFICQVVQKAYNVALPRTAAMQFKDKRLKDVAPEQMAPGDLIYFKNTYKSGISHTAIYMGDGQYAQMLNKSKDFSIGRVGDSLWQKNLAGVKRLPPMRPSKIPNANVITGLGKRGLKEVGTDAQMRATPAPPQEYQAFGPGARPVAVPPGSMADTVAGYIAPFAAASAPVKTALFHAGEAVYERAPGRDDRFPADKKRIAELKKKGLLEQMSVLANEPMSHPMQHEQMMYEERTVAAMNPFQRALYIMGGMGAEAAADLSNLIPVGALSSVMRKMSGIPEPAVVPKVNRPAAMRPEEYATLTEQGKRASNLAAAQRPFQATKRRAVPATTNQLLESPNIVEPGSSPAAAPTPTKRIPVVEKEYTPVTRRPVPEVAEAKSRMQARNKLAEKPAELEPAKITAPVGKATETWVDPDEIHVMEGLQYKKQDITDTKNKVSNLLKGTDIYDIEQGGQLVLYRHTDGKLYAVDAHHRRELAQRASKFVKAEPGGKLVETDRAVPARILESADGWDVDSVKRYGALLNVRGEKGTGLDAMEALRGLDITPQGFKALGVSLSGSVAKNMQGLAGLDEQALVRVRMGDIPEGIAAGIGSVKGLSPEAQRGAVQDAVQARLRTHGDGERLGRMYLEDQQSGNLADSGTGDMFGGEFGMSQSTRGTRVNIENAVRRQIQDKRASLLKPVNIDELAGEVIKKEERVALAKMMGESRDAVKDRVSLVFEHNREVQSEIARLAGEVANGTKNVEAAAREISERVQLEAGKSIAALVRGGQTDIVDAAPRGTAGPEESGGIFDQTPAVTPKPARESVGFEGTSTPQKPERFLIREEPHPLTRGKTMWRAYREDGSPVRIAENTPEQLEAHLRSSFSVKSVSRAPKNGPLVPTAKPPRAAPTPKPTPVETAKPSAPVLPSKPAERLYAEVKKDSAGRRVIVEPKELWNVTRGNYVGSEMANEGMVARDTGKVGYGGSKQYALHYEAGNKPVPLVEGKTFSSPWAAHDAYRDAAHKASVRQALEHGVDVPAEVLKDYRSMAHDLGKWDQRPIREKEVRFSDLKPGDVFLDRTLRDYPNSGIAFRKTGPSQAVRAGNTDPVKYSAATKVGIAKEGTILPDKMPPQTLTAKLDAAAQQATQRMKNRKGGSPSNYQYTPDDVKDASIIIGAYFGKGAIKTAERMQGLVDEFGEVNRPIFEAAFDNSVPATLSPKAESETPAPAAAPVRTEPQPVESATGLANQVQTRESEAGILAEVEPTKGKSPEAWQKIGKEIHDAGQSADSDFEGLAHRVANGTVELTGERVGVLLEGKRLLLNDINTKRKTLDASPGDRAALAAYEEAKTKLDDYLVSVQAGKGRWSDVGRALQAGTELDTGNFAQVLEEARRVGSTVPDHRLEALTSQVAERDVRIAELEKAAGDAAAARIIQEYQREVVIEGRANRRVRTRAALDNEWEGLKGDLAAALKKQSLNIGAKQLIEAAPILRRMAKNVIAKGVNEVGAVIDTVHAEVAKHIEGITKRQVRDAISGYGVVKAPSKDVLNQQLNLMNRAARLISQIEDAKGKKKPLRSGFKPIEDTPEVLALRAELDTVLRKFGMREPWAMTIEQRQKSAATRLKARIEDLDRRIKESDFALAQKPGIPDTPEIVKLKAAKDKLQAQYDTLKPPSMRRTLTPEQRLVMSKKAVAKTIADLSRRIRDNDMAAKQKVAAPTDAELRAAQIERDALLLQMRELRGVAGAETRIADLKRQLESGQFTQLKKVEKHVSKTLENLRAERDFWSAKVKQAVKAPEPPLTHWARALSSVIRGLKLGTDVGVLMRQGLFGWGRLLKGDISVLKATKNAAANAFTERSMLRHERMMMEERTADGRLLAAVEKKAGLHISDHIIAPEENVLGKYLARIPVVGPVLDRFQHTFINGLRRMMFRPAVKAGHTPEQLAERAKFINNVTGRGNIKQVPALMEVVFTSPRYEASRWLTIGEYVKSPITAARAFKDPAARANVTDLAATAGLVYLTYKGAELAGYEVDWDPASADFLKMRRGNEVWDVSAGIAPRVRDIMRFWIWGTEPKWGKTIADVVKSAAVRPISPAIRTPVEQGAMAYQRRRGLPVKSPFTGYEPDAHETGWLAWTPLVFNTFYMTVTEEKSVPAAVSATFKEFIGTGISRYPKPGTGGEPITPQNLHKQTPGYKAHQEILRMNREMRAPR